MTTVTLPPGSPFPRTIQGAYALATPHRGMHHMRAKYGDAFTVNVPVFGRAVVISNPAEIRQLFMSGPDQVENIQPNLGRVLGSNSLFALTGDQHRRERRLLVPPFHGRRLAAYEQIIEDETVRELATWPQERAFPTLPAMTRITLNIILRAVFGADGEDLDLLRKQMPPAIELGSKLSVLPVPRLGFGRLTPWGRFREMRRTYDGIAGRLISRAEQDENLEQRDDILAMMLQARYDDGSRMSHAEIADELLTVLAAGHETTATTLTWAIERLRRHPAILRELVDEVDAGGTVLRDATITEVLRSRPVIELVGRTVTAEYFELGRWTLPRGCPVLVSIALIQNDKELFPNPRLFDPYRFVDVKPDLYEWIPFGGGIRRCLGAAFATMEMNVVLRTLLRDFTLVPTDEPDERWRSRGVANAPAKGGRAVVRRRTAPAPTSGTATTTGARS